MGKKKGSKDDEANGDVDDEVVEETPASRDAGKKAKKGKKKKDDDWEDDVAKELEEMTLEDTGEKGNKTPEPEPIPEKKKDKKAKKVVAESNDSEEEVIVKSKKGGGFAALMDEGDDDDLDDDEDEECVVEEKKAKKKPKKEDKPKPPVEDKNDKKKGKKGKKKKNEEEDLDAILAELQLEYQGEKPKEEETKTTEQGPQPPEESGKKKKKKKKGDVAPESEKMEDAHLENNDITAKALDTPVNDVAEKEVSTPVKVIDSIDKNDIPAEPGAKDASLERKGEEEEEEEEPKEKEGDAQDEPSKAKKKKKKKAKDSVATQGDESKEGTPAPDEQGEGNAEGEEDGAGKKKKKKKDTKDSKEEDKSRKGKPSSKALAAMREILAKQKEEEERLQREEEERIRQEEEMLRQLEEEKRIEQEKKERKKQREKERKERLKAEGKLLTPKQKAEQRRAQEMLEHLKAQGVVLPEAGEKRPRPGTKIKTKKQKKEEKSEEAPLEETAKVEEKPTEVTVEVEAPVVEEVKEEVEEVKDAWDDSSDGEDEEEDDEDVSEATRTSQDTDRKNNDTNEGEDSVEDADSESEESADEQLNEAEKRRQRAVQRMAKRKEDNLKKLDPDNLRAPVVCVLGHVDHGKTKILDKLRRTNVQEGEVGGITQQIGATNVPADAVRRQTHMVKEFDMSSLQFPGLLIIDTPGHESFRNLRSRGSSLCDIAILVVDITQGLEPQTCESVELLRKRSTPFLVALNKVDRVYEWDSHPSKDIREILSLQAEPSKNDFDRRTAQVIQGLREQKLNSALFWQNPNPKEYLSLVPTSAISGDGMGNLIALICNLCQQRLKKNLVFSEDLKCTVLEVKTIQGHGTTIDVILVNGRLREGDTIILAGTDGPIVTQIRSLLLPKPLKEIRVKGQYDEFKEISAAQGVKIAARDLEKAIAGLSLKVAYHEDEIDLIKEVIDKEFKAAMRSIKVKDRGVYVQASTLGALEALLEFFKTNDVPYSGIRVGPVVKRDVMKAAAMLEHDPMYAVILAFDVKVEKDAQELADKEGVKIFSEETIYHLGDRYVDYIKDYKKKKQDEFRSVAVFPSRLKIIPTAIFNKRDPIVMGVTVDSGILRTGTPLCVPTKEFVEIGIVTSMEFDHKNVDIAKKGVDVCIKIEPVPGHTPKLFGRHFEAEDLLVSKISRESINACKDHFRDDLSKNDWRLMAELKKQFQIL